KTRISGRLRLVSAASCKIHIDANADFFDKRICKIMHVVAQSGVVFEQGRSAGARRRTSVTRDPARLLNVARVDRSLNDDRLGVELAGELGLDGLNDRK